MEAVRQKERFSLTVVGSVHCCGYVAESGLLGRLGGCRKNLMVVTADGLAVYRDLMVAFNMKAVDTARAGGPMYRAAIYLLTQSPVFKDQPETWVGPHLPNIWGADFPTLL